jgi:hypothetical protein
MRDLGMPAVVGAWNKREAVTKAAEKLVDIQQLLWEMAESGALDCVEPSGNPCGECVQCKLSAHVIQPVRGSIERGILEEVGES